MILFLLACSGVEELPSEEPPPPPPAVGDLPDPPPLNPDPDGRLSLQLQLSDGRQVFLAEDGSCFVFSMSMEEILAGKELELLTSGKADLSTIVAVECPRDMTAQPWTLCPDGRIMRDKNLKCSCVPLRGEGQEKAIECPDAKQAANIINPTLKDGRKIYLGTSGGCFVLDLSVKAPAGAVEGETGPVQAIECPTEMGKSPWTDCVNGDIRKLSTGKCECIPFVGSPLPPPFELECPAKD